MEGRMGDSATATLAITTGSTPSKLAAPIGVAETIAVSQSMTERLAHDPILIQMTWAVALVALVISVGKPIRDYIRGERRENSADKVTTAKSNAESMLYEHLSGQVSQYRTIADQAFKERNTLIERVAALESKAEELLESRAIIERLKDRLDQKDEEIRTLLQEFAEERKQFLVMLQTKDTEITKRDERIYTLERGLRELSERLARGENAISTITQPLRGGHRITDPKEDMTSA
jgi:predicted  nucleic acid-binding Zn-ribbon protein